MQVFASVGLLERLARHGIRNPNGEGESIMEPDLCIEHGDCLGTRHPEFPEYPRFCSLAAFPAAVSR